MPTINQLIRQGRKKVAKKNATPALESVRKSVESVLRFIQPHLKT